MEFLVSSSQLFGQLQLASKVVASKNTLPILDNFLFDLKDGILYITASDLETTITTNVKVESSTGEGTIAIEAKRIIDILREIPEQPIKFDISLEDLKIDIILAKGKRSIPGQSGEEFPQVPSLKSDKVASLEISPEIISTGLSTTIFATGNDELRPVMNGVFIELKPEEGINFVATDGFKIVKYNRKDIEIGEEKSFILPKKPATILKSILPKAFDKIKLEFDEKNAVFNFENIKLICRLVEGIYPNYMNVIPKNNPYKMIIDRLEFYNTLKSVSVCANQASNLIGLYIDNEKVEIVAQDYDYSTSGNDTIFCQYDGVERMEIGFKSGFLIEMLSNIQTPEVILELSDPAKAGVILPKDNENEAENILMLLMPMMIN